MRQDADVVRWFIEKRWELEVDASSPLGEMLAMAEKFDPTTDSPALETLPADWVHHQLHVVGALWRLAWGIRALHGTPDIEFDVHASFINDELQGTDSKQRWHARKLPAGVSTLFFAGRLAHMCGGRTIRISGNQVVGHDIRWVTPQSHLVLIERKDRSYEPGLNDSDASRIQRVLDDTNAGGRKIPLEPGAARILMVGFQHLVRPEEKDALGESYVRAMQTTFGRDHSVDLPDCVIVEHFGIEAKTGGQKTDFWCPLPLRRREEFRRIWPLILNAIGSQTIRKARKGKREKKAERKRERQARRRQRRRH